MAGCKVHDWKQTDDNDVPDIVHIALPYEFVYSVSHLSEADNVLHVTDT